MSRLSRYIFISMTYQEKIKSNPNLTPFQKKVLLAVLKIPKGKVRSYAWVAKEAGYPGAFRAAGRSCGMNPYAPHVPCHRVISSSGRLGGYSGRLAKKRELLRAEGVLLCN